MTKPKVHRRNERGVAPSRNSLTKRPPTRRKGKWQATHMSKYVVVEIRQ